MLAACALNLLIPRHK